MRPRTIGVLVGLVAGGAACGRSTTPAHPPAAEASHAAPARADAGQATASGPSRLDGLAPTTAEHVVLPTAADLTGVWQLVPADAAPGPHRRLTPCYEGIAFVAIEQAAGAMWLVSYQARPAQGALMVESRQTIERAAGRRDGDRASLDGEVVRETSWYDRPGPPRREVVGTPHWELAFDAAAGHLVGTRDGFAVRLAPLVLIPRVPQDGVARPNPCGPPPP